MRLRYAALFLAVAVVAPAAFATLPFTGAWRRTEAPRPVQASVGSAVFTLPSNYFRPASRAGGRMEQLDLAAFFPNFVAAGDMVEINGRTDLAARFDQTVFLSIRPADASLDPAERPTRLYARFLEADSWSHPGGLIARAFQAGSPFEGDELFFAAPEGREFAARCRKPDQMRKTPNSCIYEFRSGELDVELRFSATLLADWEKLNAGARGLIEEARR